jgi:hypothetical protein
MDDEKALRSMRVRYGQAKRLITWGVVFPLILVTVISIPVTMAIRSLTGSVALFGAVLFGCLAVCIAITAWVYGKSYEIWKCIYCEQPLFTGKVIVFRNECPHCDKKLR